MVLAVSRTCSGDEILLSHHFIRPAVLLGCPGPALYLQFQRSARHGPHIHHPSFVLPAACLRAGAGVNHSADGRAVRAVLGGGGVQSGRSFPNGSDLAETVDSGRRKCGSGNICCLGAGGQVRVSRARVRQPFPLRFPRWSAGCLGIPRACYRWRLISSRVAA